MPRNAATGWLERSAQALIGATAIVAAGIALTGTGFGPRDDTPGARLRVAMHAYEACRWTQAFAQFALLADAGDPAAARIAAMMARQGPRLFGQSFEADPRRLARWDQAMRGTPPRRIDPAVLEAAANGAPHPIPEGPVLTAAVLARDGPD